MSKTSLQAKNSKRLETLGTDLGDRLRDPGEDDLTVAGDERRPFAGPLRSPLTDSNR